MAITARGRRSRKAARLEARSTGPQPEKRHQQVTRMTALDAATEPARTRLRRPQRRRCRPPNVTLIFDVELLDVKG
jgi:hypothetical protein